MRRRVRKADLVKEAFAVEEYAPPCVTKTCKEKADVGCASCFRAYCRFCIVDHSIDRRYRKHEHCSLVELKRQLDQEAAYVGKTRKVLNVVRASKNKVAAKELAAVIAGVNKLNARREAARRAAEIQKGFRPVAVVKLSKGRRYEGEIDPDRLKSLGIRQAVGRGQLFSADGVVIYDGQWQDGQMHGRGIWYYRNSRSFKCPLVIWEGVFHKGVKNGIGILTSKIGDRIQGRGKCLFSYGQCQGAPEDLVGKSILIGGLRVGNERSATICDFNNKTDRWFIQYSDFARESRWANLVQESFKSQNQYKKVYVMEPYLQNPSVLYNIKSPSARHVIRSLAQVEDIDDLKVTAIDKSQMGRTHLPRILPVRGIHVSDSATSLVVAAPAPFHRLRRNLKQN